MKQDFKILFIALCVTVVMIGCSNGNKEDHSGHDHDDHKDEKVVDEHAGHDHGEDTAEAVRVDVTLKGAQMVGIEVETVQMRTIETAIELPGEVVLNQDNVAHVTPRFSGIIKSINKQFGQYVKKGDVLATVENNETFSTFKVTAPISGRILEKHATVGEFASEEGSLFVIADLSTVWIDIDVFPAYLKSVSVGDVITIQAVGSDAMVASKIRYLSPVLNVETRTATARVVISNRNNSWRPGTFIHGTVINKAATPMVSVANEGIQILDEKSVVFVPVKDGYQTTPIVLGKRGKRFSEVLEGLHAGDSYVGHGAFDLKAAVVTSSLSGHAGHGH